MDKQKKCSSKEHLEIDAIIFCQICKIYMCNKCEKMHSNLLPQHHPLNLNEDIKDIFTGFCKEENHPNKFQFFCKNHNQLCCAFCICKIKGEGLGQHNDCNACFIKEIELEKKNKLKENIKCLEDLSISLGQAIHDLKNIFEKVNENKEELKLKIQNIFTKIRNSLNNREDELLLEIEKQYSDNFGGEDIIKEFEKLPNKVKKSLEKGKRIEKEWNNNDLSSNINDCINIENNINEINILNETIKKSKLNNKKEIKFSPDDNGINNFIEQIKILGRIYYNSFKFKKCPTNIKDYRKYIINGEKENILTKTGPDNWIGTICENELEISKEYKWKIKILKTTQYKQIMVGVAPIDFDINLSTHKTCGWYLYCYDSSLYSGPPHNFCGKASKLSKVKDEIEVVMNMKKRTLKFIINNEDKGESYTDIPTDKPLTPAICLYNLNDSVEIIEC